MSQITAFSLCRAGETKYLWAQEMRNKGKKIYCQTEFSILNTWQYTQHIDLNKPTLKGHFWGNWETLSDIKSMSENVPIFFKVPTEKSERNLSEICFKSKEGIDEAILPKS